MMRLFILFFICAPLWAQDSWLLIKAERIFRGDGDRMEEHVDILCKGDRIEKMGKNLQAPPGATVIEGKDLCALPGLIDTHVRLDDGFLVTPVHHFLAHGVTTVRDFYNSSLRVKGLVDIIEAGEIAGPRIVYSGESITSLDRVSPFQIQARTPEEARNAVKKLIQGGAGFIALAPGTKLDVAKAVMEEAGDLPVAADFLGNREIDALQAVHLGIRSLERLGGVAQAVGEKSVDDKSPLFDWLNRDEAKERELIQAMAKGGVYLVPTLVAFEQISMPDHLVLDETRHNLPSTAWEHWREVRSFHVDLPWWPAACLLHLDYSKSFLGKAIQANVPIAAGSGTPTPGVAPGAGLIREMELLSETELGPAGALRSATSVAASCLGLEQDLGTLEPDKMADIIVIKGDPIQDISAISDIMWVVTRGEALKRDEMPGFER